MPDHMELARIITTSQEGLALEFKRTMNWADGHTRGKVIRTVLGFANVRDGGILALGVVEKQAGPGYDYPGMTQSDYDSFTLDGVSATVNAHATPHIDLSVEHLQIEQNLFVAIVVRQFSDYPVICAKDFVIDGGKPVVSRGRIYCRSRRTPETTDVQTPDDMRDIIELATGKGIERYFRLRGIERQFEGPTADQRFEQQGKDL